MLMCIGLNHYIGVSYRSKQVVLGTSYESYLLFDAGMKNPIAPSYCPLAHRPRENFCNGRDKSRYKFEIELAPPHNELALSRLAYDNPREE